jgi:hypothetical protein
MYHFLIWDISPKGMSILVKEDSHVLKSLKIGDSLDMKYFIKDSPEPTEYLKTRIRHITKDEQGRFEGHFLVGLSFTEQ